MDITAVQAEASTKAAAWLTTNLQVEAPPAEPAVTPPPAAAAPAVVEPPKPGLAAAIREDRDRRSAAQTAQAEAGKYKGEVEALRKENEALKALGAATDPYEFLKGRRLTKEQQALWGQAFLYDLKPEVAPQEFRLDLYKAEQARKEAAAAEAEERESAEQAQQAQRAQLDRYASDLYQHVLSSPGSNPESELWFSEDGADGQPAVNQRAYAQSLFATANNLAEAARKSGQQANLDPANIAKVLEAEVSKRMARRDAKKAGSAKTDTQGKPATAASGTQATEVTSTTSAEGLRSGAPIPPDLSEAGRRARAAAALFGTK